MYYRTILNRGLLAALSIALSIAAFPQQQLTLRDAVLKAGTELAPQRMRGLQWVSGTDSYSWVKGEELLWADVRNNAPKPVTTLAALNAALTDSIKLRGIPSVEWTSKNSFRFLHNGTLYAYTVDSGALEARVVLLAGAANEDIEASTGQVAFTVENDLFIGVPGGGKARRITNDGTDGIVNGHSVHRQEYGITKGTFWSPQGSRLAFYRMDETMVTKYQLEDITTTPSTFDGIRYPMAGATSHHVTVGVHDLKTGNTIFLKTGEPLDQYLTNISWSVDERYVHVVHLDRKTENLELVRYDASTGERVATLHREHDDRYLEPQHPAHFLKTRPDEYLWRSDKDGWPHYHLLAKPEGEARQLTRGPWVPKELIGIDPKEGYMVISGTAKIDGAMPTGATETHVYRVELPSGKTTRLTNEPGTHYGQLSTSGRYLIDQWSSTSVPGRTVIRDASTGKVVSTLIESTDPMKGRTVGTIELLAIKGENNDLLNARLIKPSTFDPAKRYPVLIYVYNGPHVQLVSNSFLGGASPWMLEAAERGYLVWTVDGHGSAYRGADFERIIHRQLGIVEVKDQMRGVEYLKGLAFVDPDRIAVHGWSFGGHMTTAMLLRNPGVFKVGVAGGPVMDWSLYEVMYTERYMDTPEENPEGYIATALPPAAAQLQEDLLLITGSQDDTVLPQHSLRFIQACVANGVQVDYFAYPGHGHNVRGKDRLHLMEKVLRHIDQFIVPER